MSAKIEITAGAKEAGGENGPTEFRVVDRRHFLDTGKAEPGPAAEEKPRYPSFVEELVGKMTATERKFEEKKAQMEEEIARTRARLEADYSRRAELDKQKVLLPLLDVLDNLERALAASGSADSDENLRRGVEMTAGLFRARLQSLGVEAIPVLNQPFDPNVGQAVGVISVADPDQDGLVQEEVLRGYRIGEQILRPAHVLVGKHS